MNWGRGDTNIQTIAQWEEGTGTTLLKYYSAQGWPGDPVKIQILTQLVGMKPEMLDFYQAPT